MLYSIIIVLGFALILTLFAIARNMKNRLDQLELDSYSQLEAIEDLGESLNDAIEAINDHANSIDLLMDAIQEISDTFELDGDEEAEEYTIELIH